MSEFDGEANCQTKIIEDEEELDRSLILEDEEVEKKPNKVSRIKIVDLK